MEKMMGNLYFLCSSAPKELTHLLLCVHLSPRSPPENSMIHSCLLNVDPTLWTKDRFHRWSRSNNTNKSPAARFLPSTVSAFNNLITEWGSRKKGIWILASLSYRRRKWKPRETENDALGPRGCLWQTRAGAPASDSWLIQQASLRDMW